MCKTDIYFMTPLLFVLLGLLFRIKRMLYKYVLK